MEPKSTAIYNYLEGKIIQGTLNPGDKLPSESELCAKFSVSRGPVRAALDKLSAIGLVFKKKGGGSYVTEQGMDNFLNVVLPTLKFNTVDFNEIMEIRCALEKLCIELCLNNHEKNNYEQLDNAMKAMVKEVNNKDTFFELDRKFHTSISLLSGNLLLHNFNQLIWDLLKNNSKKEYHNQDFEKLVIEHKRIYKGIKENDRELAVLYTVRHLKRSIFNAPQDSISETDKKRWNPWLFNTL
ncbi:MULTISPECIES: FadR/GntR family transcriptional regulator [unclassified Oceanispirochaeta]|uniref:FadR/GntR family transcriptional regulator n=1 Tax=unclassified Oceanispirochaeta TaxID=2635722 RepID=UPI000E099793|nr:MULTISPECIES: FadR/GntR family transcriptional regulator [unclassified Oceanispirochaeta]MBF9014052.1 FadR family transcriptional regulator [Oceanispirochaeta sp. M2]NPD70543.1 FadR family transcriptional regulator [Oceanispirochaeta sp. M1]RDG34311.1 FadR family transcriptional regulator [Oceanispirochaeta sp. M1]